MGFSRKTRWLSSKLIISQAASFPLNNIVCRTAFCLASLTIPAVSIKHLYGRRHYGGRYPQPTPTRAYMWNNSVVISRPALSRISDLIS